MIKDGAAFAFFFICGAAVMGAFAYRDEIRAYLKLEKSGTIDEVRGLVETGRELYNQLRPGVQR